MEAIAVAGYTRPPMDAVADIKARLSIEALVGEYCQLQKKGRNFVCLCPFHKDSHPSFLVSPDKGIAYCFACQTGGDIFSFYQKIEGVDFRQALQDLAEKTGVTVEKMSGPSVSKDEKQRARECLETALQFYREQLQTSDLAKKYLAERQVPQEQIDQFQLGYAPDSYTATYDQLLKRGFSRKEILQAGLCIQKDLQEERMYDRFRHRLMFPIHDAQGALVGFGGRTLGQDDAKYINSSEGLLFHKSQILYGLHHAKEGIRTSKTAILVEGYFDVLACHRVGVTTAVATCGTALTDEHVKLLKRYVESISLCLDQDRAGRDAAERAFLLLSAAAVNVKSVRLQQKDPNDALQSGPDVLKKELETGGIPYLDGVLRDLAAENLQDPFEKRKALERVLTLLQALPFAVERQDYLAKAAGVFSTSPTALQEDLDQVRRTPTPVLRKENAAAAVPFHQFSSVEIALSLFLLFPKLRTLLDELIPPTAPFAAALYEALKNAPEGASLSAGDLPLPEEHQERAAILHLFAEEHGFAEWSEAWAVREVRKNCQAANRDMLREKQQEITKGLLAARAANNAEDEALLTTQYQQLLRLMKKAN